MSKIEQLKNTLSEMEEYLGKEAYNTLINGESLALGSKHLEIWENNPKDKFLDIIFSHPHTKTKCSTAYMAKELNIDKKLINSLCNNEYTKTISSAGYVRVGNKQFTINIPSSDVGHINGESSVIIMDYDQWNPYILDFFSTMRIIEEDNVYVYDYDYSGGKPLVKMKKGCYNIFYGNRIVCFALLS